MKKIAAIALMGAGILFGAITLLIIPESKEGQSWKLRIEDYQPDITFSKSKSHLMEMIKVFHARNRMEKLMQKDHLTAADTIEIKAIDQQLNQLIHD